MLNARRHQAEGLHQLQARVGTAESMPMRVVPVLAALPGVGKRTLLRQLLQRDQRGGGRPLALDEDADTLATLFDLPGTGQGRHDLLEHLDGHLALEEVIRSAADGIPLIDAERGLASLALRPVALARFLDSLAERRQRTSTLWVNARASDRGVVHTLAELGMDVLVVTTTDADAMTATYQLIKRLSARQLLRVRVLYNCATSEQAARAHEGLADASQRFIGLSIDSPGSIPFDPLLARSGAQSPPGVQRRPTRLDAAGCARSAVDRLLRELARRNPNSLHTPAPSDFAPSNA